MVYLTIEGGKELKRKLLNIANKTGKKIVRQAVRKSLKPIQETAKANARNMVGGNMGRLLSKNVILRALRKQRTGQYAMNVRLRTGIPEFIHRAVRSKYPGGATYIPAAIEYGHDNVAAIPFMRVAADRKTPVAERIMHAELKAGIEKEGIKG